MLPRGNDEISGNQFIDEASQNEVLAICIQIPTKIHYMTRIVEAVLSEVPPERL